MERAIYALAAAVLLHAAATYWGGGRYGMLGDQIVMDTHSGDVWVLSLAPSNPMPGARLHHVTRLVREQQANP